jgi:hypothetical protein
MKTVFLAATMFVLCLANATGQGKLLASDPLTDLPLISATGRHIGNLSYTNKPTQMPDGQICKSKFQGNFYSLFNIKVDAAIASYSSHLSGFKKVSGYASKRSQTAFYNSDGTIVVIVTGDSGAQGENTDAYSVAYERYQPGISEKTITALTQGNIVCQ